jgi:phospholipid-translocating ATPase
MSFVPDILTPGQIFIFLLGIGFLGALTIIWRRNGTPRFARKLRHSGETRQVRVNGAHPEFPDNTVANTKYRPLAIFPLKGLFLQLKHNTNRYFLFIAVLQLNTNITPVNPLTTWLPLIFVVAISMTKDLIDDLGRRRADRLANAREYVVCKGASRVPTRASALRVGDVVRLAQDDEVPADCVVLKTSDELGGCYIQTTNLDGESDLKPRRALIETQTMAEEEMGTLNGTINCAHPNAAIYSFDANLTLEASGAKKFSLSTEHLALQCTHVRNTEFVYAAIVYAGEQTKYGCNKRAPPDKIPKAGVFVNRLVIVVFLSQLCLAFLFGGLGMGWYATSGVQLRYLGYNQAAGDSAWSSYVVFPLRFLILISVMIPISLQVTIEINRWLYAKWINLDVQMYDAPSDTPARAASTTLAEDLGQIEYVLTDKTGTLTENEMSFKKCSINSVMYGHSADALDVWKDAALKKQLRSGDETVVDYFRCLALNHAVMPSPIASTDGVSGQKYRYASASPDEEALCAAASFFNVTFTERTTTELHLRVGEGDEAAPERWLLLNTLEFSSDRKRMSVIVRDAAVGSIRIFIKGADDKIAERVRSGQDLTRCRQHLDTFAELGLRTLLVGVRDLDESEYQAWVQRFEVANAAVLNREEQLEQVYDSIERDFTLLGATAIEDRLQEGVPETIALLRRANLRFWMLTGDKYATAIQVGRACRLMSPESSGASLLVVSGETADEVGRSISKHLAAIREGAPGGGGDGGSGGGAGEITVIVEGRPLGLALEHHLDAFGELGTQAHCVICCRVTPAQKGAVVKLVKQRKRMTLAIGDGGNDVAMIQEAHVGVGISGKEGLQAARAADYAIGRFRFLQRLLLVHGRYSYKRTALVAQYAFYRSFYISFIQLLFNIYAGFSGASFFHSIPLSGWSIITIPASISLTLDKDVSERSCLTFPALYKEGQTSAALNLATFSRWGLQGWAQAAVVFFLCFSSFGTEYMHPRDGYVIDLETTGMACYTISLFVMIAACYVEHNSLHRWNHALNLLGLLLYLVVYAVGSFVHISGFDIYLLHGTLQRLATDIVFFPIGSLTITAAAVLPVLALKVVKYQLAPAPYQVVQLYERRRKNG